MNKNNRPDHEFKEYMCSQKQKWLDQNQTTTLDKLLSRTKTEPQSTSNNCNVQIYTPHDPKTKQIVATLLFVCYNEIPLSNIGYPHFQGLINIFGGRSNFTSKQILDGYLLETYDSVCRIIRRLVTAATIGCITVDAWSSALGAPILGITWHYINND